MNQVALSGKVAVVTGGGRGIGRATCEALAREGVRVVVADLDGAAAEAVATAIGKNAISRSLDVSNREQFRSVLDAAEQHFGPLDILVNNAGIMPVGYFIDETDEMTDRLVDVNYRGTLIGMKEALRRMKPRGAGHIVNLASTGGWLPAPGVATYVGTKHAIVGLTDSVRLELTGSGINLSSVGPGIVKTELAAGLQEMRGMRGVTPEEVADAIIEGLKRKRHAIFSPGVVGIAAHVYGALPYTLRSLLFRVTKIDRLGPQIDQGTRKDYEARVVASISRATDAES
ncbi:MULTISPECIES: SDR family NAD(P)-dependent oxidoreductase [Rhodococcus]|uniref:SDR family NAD(P)-dependent oxidoreductase n=1 Tax=Rhodococcus TaxID=1827 RepID=UPI0019802EE8|nr:MULTISPECIES: SDR family NAD(P)-dependent oxidoreductase [Rhodococcus]MDI9947697.1 SDR family NAD(P)-dependent oxidoreductase [Rhodococcus sp. IEGM 1305]QSE86421.1 SDR family NAD(P)-dependent oxidoreductase [Rhodococcus koreensis]